MTSKVGSRTRLRSLSAFSGLFILLMSCGNSVFADELLAQVTPADPETITPAQREFFENKIRPVLVKHCYSCHSAESPSVKGGLWLDSHPGLLEGGDSGPSIVPGDADASLLLESMRYESYEMPPEGQLPQHILDDFARWIEMGAPDPRKTNTKTAQAGGIDWEQARQFWSFQPVKAPELPAEVDPVSFAAIDHFIKRAHQQNQLPSQAMASEEVLLRRLYYDLTGLPPTLEQQKAYFDGNPQTRWESLVHQLLNSQSYAEHWGRKWLDVVRYADSNGSDFNATFYDAWRYRDYVIQSFAQDVPYNEFVRQQIAGDLMPAQTDQQKRNQIIATGFLALGPKMLSERNKEKLRYDIVDEQIDSLGKVFLGMTLGCARCHDHKFDPIPTEDYYSLAGIFTSTQTIDGEIQQYVSDWVKPGLPMLPAEQKEITEFEAKIELAKQELKQLKNDQNTLKNDIALLEGEAREWLLDNDQLKLTGDWVESTFSKYRYGKNYVHDNNQGKGEKTAEWVVNQLPEGTYHIALAYNGGPARADKVPLTVSWEEDGKAKTEQLVYAQKRAPTTQNLFEQLLTIKVTQTTDLHVLIETSGSTGYVIVDALKVTDANPAVQLAKQERARLKELKSQAAEMSDNVATATEKVKTLEKAKPKPPTALAVSDSKEPADCEICIRGELTHRGEVVPRGVLSVIAGEDSAFRDLENSGRLELANWIASSENPLTARVLVNRVWMHLIGKGIVSTVDNFGALGAEPTHPELLDHLAHQFVQQGWSIKQLIRTIVLSESYRRGSLATPEMIRADPDNRWLTRAERRRLTAESLRDTLLSVTDMLAEPTPGSPVSHLKRIAVNNNGDGSLGSDVTAAQRTLFLPVVRNEIAPFLVAFDFADPDVVVGQRAKTNVPSQALLMMNNKFIIEQSKQLAEQTRPEQMTDSAIEQKLDELFQKLLVRRPTSDEQSLLTKFYQQAEKQNHELRWQTIVQSLIASTHFRLLD